ncbi:MAG: threonine/serine exporter family protein [Planctomycetota bacterium]|nr:threonine/serine exporter family protein [Planctomycetota bacterium]
MIQIDNKLQNLVDPPKPRTASHPASPENEAAAGEMLMTSLAEALHRYGTASHELEEILQACAEKLQLDAAFFSTPTAIFISFPASSRRQTVLQRVSPGEIDLQKLVEVDRIVTRFLNDQDSIQAATLSLKQLSSKPGAFSPLVSVIGFGIASGTVVSFFQGGSREILVTSMIGLLVGGLEQVARWNPDFARAYCAIASFLAAFLAVAASRIFPGLSSEIVTLGSLIVLVPGLTITMAVGELARQHLASGTSRFMGAVLLFLILGFGVALGRNLGLQLLRPPESVLSPAGPLMFCLCLLLAPVSFAILFRTRKKDILLVFLTCLLGFGCGKMGAFLVGVQLGPALRSFGVAVFSNLVSRALKQPAALTLVPGLMFLVPGSIGFLGFQALVEQETMAGMQSAFQVLFVSAALVSGLLMANVLVHPRRWTVPPVSAALPKTVGEEPSGEAADCLDRQD